MMKVTIVNDTPYTFEVGDGGLTVFDFLRLGRIYPVNQKGSSYTYEFFQDTLVDWNLFLKHTDDSSKLHYRIPAYDNEQAREIRVYETPSNEIRHWISKPRQSSDDLWARTAPAFEVSSSSPCVHSFVVIFVKTSDVKLGITMVTDFDNMKISMPESSNATTAHHECYNAAITISVMLNRLFL